MVDKVTLDGLRIARPDVERKSRVPLILVTATIIVTAVVIALVLTRGSGKGVRVAPAKAIASQARGAVLNASGYVTARRQATVSSKVTGKVIDIYIEEGMHVKQGQELARLDSSIVSRGLAVAQAEAAAAKSALEETRVRIREAQIDYDRAAHLAQSEVGSRSDLDHARAQLEANRARLSAQGDQLASAQRRVAIGTPSSGVKPIVVSTERPSRTAVTEQPPPRWQTTSRGTRTCSLAHCTERPWKP